MRLNQRIPGLFSRFAACGAGGLLFASGLRCPLPDSSSPQAAPTARPRPRSAPAVGQLPLIADDAVRMALENNLGLQTERLNPQIARCAVSRALAAYTPDLFSRTPTRSTTAPPTDFLSSGGDVTYRLRTLSPAAASSRTAVARRQLLGRRRRPARRRSTPRRPRSTRGSARTSTSQFTQPLLRDFRIDCAAPAGPDQSREPAGDRRHPAAAAHHADVAQRCGTPTTRSCGAIAGWRSRSSRSNRRRQSLRNNQTRVEVGTMAPIDIVAARSGGRAATRRRSSSQAADRAARRTTCGR